jgi:hypothetical protein
VDPAETLPVGNAPGAAAVEELHDGGDKRDVEDGGGQLGSGAQDLSVWQRGGGFETLSSRQWVWRAEYGSFAQQHPQVGQGVTTQPGFEFAVHVNNKFRDMSRTEIGQRTLKFSLVKEWPTHTAQVSRPIIHRSEHTRAKSFRPEVVSTRWVLLQSERCTVTEDSKSLRTVQPETSRWTRGLSRDHIMMVVQACCCTPYSHWQVHACSLVVWCGCHDPCVCGLVSVCVGHGVVSRDSPQDRYKWHATPTGHVSENLGQLITRKTPSPST